MFQYCISTPVNIKLKKMTVELVFKEVSRVRESQWRRELDPYLHHNIGKERFVVVRVYLSTFKFCIFVSRSQSVIDHKQFWFVHNRETINYFETSDLFSSEMTILKGEHVRGGNIFFIGFAVQGIILTLRSLTHWMLLRLKPRISEWNLFFASIWTPWTLH